MYFVHVYIFFKKIKKKIQNFFFKISKSFPQKKREKFSNEKSLWTRGIEPLSHLKKNFFELGALDFLVTFFKKGPFFFSFKDFKIL